MFASTSPKPIDLRRMDFTGYWAREPHCLQVCLHTRTEIWKDKTIFNFPDITEHKHYIHTYGKVKFGGVNNFKLRCRNLILTAKQDKTISFLRWDWSKWSLKELFYHHSFLSSNMIIPQWDGVGVRNHEAAKYKKNLSVRYIVAF